jgi:hypothetical protein
MNLSNKWTAVSFVTLSAIGVACLAFGGCTVTTGTINSDGGTIIDDGGIIVDNDADVTADASILDSAVPNACPGNTKQAYTWGTEACQSALDTACCAQLTACFSIVVDQDAAGPTNDCNKYAKAIDDCQKKADGTPETDNAKIQACQDDADLLSPKTVVDAYNAIITCGNANATANAACNP